MLIVGADDLGASPRVSRAILECLDRGLVSSASAMMWMHGTTSAAEQARERRAPVGLHLNFTLPFDADDTPPRVRERQLALTRIFTKESWREPAAHPELASLVRDAVRDQLDRFREELGEPTHVDGHHHVHVHQVVLEALPPELPIRAPLTAPDSEPTSFLGRWARRRSTSRRTHALEHVHPALGGVGLETLVRSRDLTMEIVTHPADPRNREALESSDWTEAIAALPVGSYRQLDG